MLFNLSEVMAMVGQTKSAQVPIGFEIFSMCGEAYPVVSNDDVSVEVVCTGERKVQITCHSNVTVQVPCSRCLKSVQVPFEIDFQKEFCFDGTKEHQEELEEAIYIEEFDLNVDCLVSEEMMLQFPLQTLCKDDCKGICGICGKDLNEDSCDCHLQGRDPRMLAIQDIFKNFGQTDN